MESAAIGLAQVLARRGAWQQAETRLAELGDAGSSQAFVHLARLQEDRGDLDAARSSLEQARVIAPADARPLLALARLARGRRDAAEADSAYRAYLALRPDDIEAALELSAFLEQVGLFDEAQIVFRACAAREPDHPAVLAARGRAAHSADNLREAHDLFERCIALAPGRIGVHHALARVRISLGEIERAFLTLDAIESRTGPRPDHDYVRIEQYRRLGHLAEAVAAAERARSRFPGDMMLWSQHCIIQIDLGHFDAVEAAIAGAPARNRLDAGRLDIVAGALALARWEGRKAAAAFARARAALPLDRWLIDRIVQADLLNLDMESALTHLKERATLNIAMNRRRRHSTNWSQNFLGQLFNEYRIDPEALDAMRAIAAAENPAELARAGRAMADFPDNAALAMQFLVAARRVGVLDRRRHGPARIPARIAQFWDSAELPPDIADYCASWRNQHPDFDYHRFNAAEAEAYLAEKADRAVLVAFRRAREPAMKADLFRLAFLLADGGFYTDADDRCQRPMTPLRDSGAALIGYQEDLGSVGNNFLAAVPGHPVIRAALQLAVEAVMRSDADVLWLSTGPGLITRVIAAAAMAAPSLEEGLSGITVLTRADMLRYAAIHCATSYKHTDKHWTRSSFNAVRTGGDED